MEVITSATINRFRRLMYAKNGATVKVAVVIPTISNEAIIAAWETVKPRRGISAASTPGMTTVIIAPITPTIRIAIVFNPDALCSEAVRDFIRPSF